VKVRGSDGRLLTLFPSARHRSVLLTNVLPFESFTATVTAKGGSNLLPGPSATGRLAALRTHRPPLPQTITGGRPKKTTGKRKG
jgi:hypothetical protein